MGDLYDDKIETMLITRQRMSEQKKVQRQKELQKQYCVVAGALVVLLIVIVLIFKACGGEKDSKPKDKITSTTAAVEVAEEHTTLAENATDTEVAGGSENGTSAEGETDTESDTDLEDTTGSEDTTDSGNTTDEAGDVMYTTDVLNFRTEPSTDGALIRHLEKGTEVKVLSTNDGWCKIEYGDHTGYVSQEYLSATRPE